MALPSHALCACLEARKEGTKEGREGGMKEGRNEGRKEGRRGALQVKNRMQC